MLNSMKSRLVATLLILLSSACLAAAQTGIRLSTSIDEAAPPAEWYAMQPGTDKYVAKSDAGWGVLSTPPGRYEVLVVPAGETTAPFRTPVIAVAANSLTTVDIDSGFKLTSANGLPPLAWWVVKKTAGGEVVAQNVQRWGLNLLPPGQYRLETQAGNETIARNISVGAGTLLEMDVAELGIGHLRIDDAKSEAKLLFGGETFETFFEYQGETFLLGPVNDQGWTGVWAKAGLLAVERRNGAFVHRQELEITPGQKHIVAFDLPSIVQARGYATLRFDELVDTADRLTVTSMNGDKLLVSETDPDLGREMIAPVGSRARIRVGDEDRFVGWSGSGPSQNAISLAVEIPENGQEMEPNAETSTVVGHASAIGSAGATRIAVVVDTSHSTADSTEIDLDADGDNESIFDAEIAAVRTLISELTRVEEDSPGTAFELALVTFGVSALSVTPLSKLDDEGELARLLASLDSIGIGAQGADTFYDRGIDAAMRVMSTKDTGPAVILFVTDGKPSQPQGALDAAARVGDKGIILHTIGLGPDFRGGDAKRISYPASIENGADILSLMASLGAPESQSWSLPKPAEIVALVPKLPVLARSDALIRAVTIKNLDTSQDAHDVELFADGAFRGVVPVDPRLPFNRLEVTAFGEQGEASTIITLPSRGFDLQELEFSEIKRKALATELSALRVVLDDQEADLIDKAKRLALMEQELSTRSDDANKLNSGISALKVALQSNEKQVLQCQKEQISCDANLQRALELLAAPETVGPGIQRITVSSDILFDFGEATLSPKADVRLLTAAQYINRAHQRSNIRLDGHTDGIGSAADNIELSEQRAKAVRDWFFEQGGIASDRLTTRGLGEANPLVPETSAAGQDDPEARQQNRRVEIYLEK